MNTKIKLLICLLTMFVPSCSAPEESKETLEKAGFSDIEITGWIPLQCSKGDTFSTGFKATNPLGKRVEGVVCCGWPTKACTIRF